MSSHFCTTGIVRGKNVDSVYGHSFSLQQAFDKNQEAFLYFSLRLSKSSYRFVYLQNGITFVLAETAYVVK